MLKENFNHTSHFTHHTSNKGITLIALVITVIVMLILVAVTITTAINGGLFEKAGQAVGDTQNAINAEQQFINDIIEEYFGNSSGGNGGEEIETIPTTESYVGYYADIDGNGTVDGIIYADLAFSVSGVGNNDDWSNYEYSAKSDLKNYAISTKTYEGQTTSGIYKANDGLGTKSVVVPNGGTGNDRFYVMALSDVTTADYTSFYWYYNAKGKLDRAVATDYNDFGEGKSNTIAMLNDWNNNTDTYGAQNTRDLWGVIQNSEDYDIVESVNDSKKWFVPSKAEWSAFGDYLYTKLGVTTSDYSDYGLSSAYWSSSQYGTDLACGAIFFLGSIGYDNVDYFDYVRLSATF